MRRESSGNSAKRPFINAIPKSGTNLLQKALELLGMRFSGLGIAESLIHGRHFWLRQTTRGGWRERTPLVVGLDAPVSVSRKWLGWRLDRVRQSEYVTGHANYSLGLHSLLQMHGFGTVVVVRDPRAVLASHAQFFAEAKNYFLYPLLSSLDLEERILVTITGGDFPRHGLTLEPFAAVLGAMAPWIEGGFDDVLVVRFEDLVGIKGGGDEARQLNALRALAQFLELEMGDARLAQVAGSLFGGTHTFRRGHVDKWREDVGSAMLGRMTNAVMPYLERWGYEE